MRLSWGGFVGATVQWGKDWRGSRVEQEGSSGGDRLQNWWGVGGGIDVV